MNRQLLGLTSALVASVAVALPSSTATTSATVTAKQAALRGGNVAPRALPEQRVSRLIVKLRVPATTDLVQPLSASRVQALSATAGVNLKSVRAMATGGSLLALDTALPLSEARAVAARLQNDPAVVYAVPDVMYKKLQATPTDPFFSTLQWNLFAPTSNYTGALTSGGTKSAVAMGAANLPPAWVTTTGVPGVVIAVIDTGLVNHPDLNNAGVFSGPYVPTVRFLTGYDFVSSTAGAEFAFPANFTSNDGNGRDPDASDPGDWITAAEEVMYPECDDGQPGPQHSSWHGSHTAGVAAAVANNAVGIAGIGWGVTVLPVRALGKCGGSLSDIAEAIVWAAGLTVTGVPNNLNPAQVINVSLGSTPDIQCDGPMQDAVNFALGRGATVVAATGNHGAIGLGSPAKCTGVIAVTAHTINGENSDFANVGVGTTISAPGGGKPTTLGAGGATDDPTWAGYYVWSTVLRGLTAPSSADSSGVAGSSYAGFAGTSGATPQVSGVAALIKSIPASAGATPEFVRSWLTAGGNVRRHPAGGACEVFLIHCGKGLLDAERAVTAAVNLIPAVNAGPNQVVLPAAAVTATATAMAYPGKSLGPVQWTQLNSPAVALTGATTLNVSFIAPPSPGTVVLQFSATDSAGQVANDIISIRSNRPPVLGPIPAALTVTAGQIVNFTVTAADPDVGEPVLFGSTALPGGASFTSAGVFNWDTTGAAPMTYTFTYFATDTISPSESASVAITVNAVGTPPGGTPPGGTPPGGSPPPTGGGGGGGATPLWQLLLLSALMLGARIRRRE